jgi:phosphoserine aminotransferase
MSRKFNFSAGPSTLPVPVLEQIRDEMVDFRGAGLSLIEASHRGKQYDAVHLEAVALFKELFGVPDGHTILFLQGGATLQFAMVPMNLCATNKKVDLVNSGAWAKKALEDIKKVGGEPRVIFDGKASNYMTLPDPAGLDVSPDAAYLHLTSNETIGGVQWKAFPDTGAVPLVADMSSDILSRRVPVEKFGLIYAGAQKNLGPAGLAIVIIRDDVLERCPDNLPAYLGYKTHAKENSLYNTPPVFAIYAMGLTLAWVKAQGGLPAIEALAKKRAGLLYAAIDGSNGYYRCPVPREFRSDMNLVWRLPSEELEEKFIKEASAAGMIQLKGHRSVGGVRASCYNAMPVEGASTLASFMSDFQKRNG